MKRPSLTGTPHWQAHPKSSTCILIFRSGAEGVTTATALRASMLKLCAPQLHERAPSFHYKRQQLFRRGTLGGAVGWLGLLPLVDDGQGGLLLLLPALQGLQGALETLVPDLIGRHAVHLWVPGESAFPSNSAHCQLQQGCPHHTFVRSYHRCWQLPDLRPLLSAYFRIAFVTSHIPRSQQRPSRSKFRPGRPRPSSGG